MKSSFRKISRVVSLTGGTKWYLSEDCLLAAKRTMYAVEYRRFYLRDLQYIMVWPRRFWALRLMIRAVLLAALAASFWLWVDFIAGAILGSVGLLWVAWDLAFGPTAASRICTTGASLELTLVRRTRRARKVLSKIDAAVRATRGSIEQPTASAIVTRPAEPSGQTRSEASATTIAAATQTNAF